MIALEAELAEGNAAHVPLVNVAARSEADGKKAQEDLKGLKIYFGKVKQKEIL